MGNAPEDNLCSTILYNIAVDSIDLDFLYYAMIYKNEVIIF